MSNAIRYRKLEKVLKGGANHWRLAILFLLKKNPGLSVDQVAQNLKGNFVTISNHLQKLSSSGLVAKKYKGRMVVHTLTPYGENIITFCKML